MGQHRARGAKNEAWDNIALVDSDRYACARASPCTKECAWVETRAGTKKGAWVSERARGAQKCAWAEVALVA